MDLLLAFVFVESMKAFFSALNTLTCASRAALSAIACFALCATASAASYMPCVTFFVGFNTSLFFVTYRSNVITEQTSIAPKKPVSNLPELVVITTISDKGPKTDSTQSSKNRGIESNEFIFPPFLTFIYIHIWSAVVFLWLLQKLFSTGTSMAIST
jgi:hypothetical protein